MKESLTNLVESTLILIADLNVCFSDPDSPLDPLDIQNFSCALRCMLLQWHHENEAIQRPLEDALCVAMLIFTVRTTEAIQNLFDARPLYNVARRQLEKALKTTTRDEWAPCPDLLLWILSIEAVSSGCSSESIWFVQQIALTCEEFGLRTKDDLIHRLHMCGWVKFKLNEAVVNLWDRIEHVRLADR